MDKGKRKVGKGKDMNSFDRKMGKKAKNIEREKCFYEIIRNMKCKNWTQVFPEPCHVLRN